MLLVCGHRCRADQSAGHAASQLQVLFEQKRWEDVVRTAGATSTRTPEVEYYHGAALAQLGRWDDAQAHLRRGLRLHPRDERLLFELAGIAFKRKRLSEAVAWLRKANRANPNSDYANNFLGTLYFLQGNTEGALKYWNRLGKPVLSEIAMEPGLRTDPVLLDRAFAFGPDATLLLDELRTTSARLSALGVFSNEAFRLEAHTGGKFTLRFTARERNGAGANRWHAAVSTLRGLPFQAIQPQYFNVAGRAVNVTSLLRWDPQKRRLKAQVSSPLGADPRYRWWLEADGREEAWTLRSGPAEVGSLDLRRTAVSAGISAFKSGNWRWSSAAELSHRTYRHVAGALGGEPSLRYAGYQLKHTMNLARGAWRSPEDGIETMIEAFAETGKIWARSSELFQRFQVAAGGRWMPQRTSGDYTVHAKIRAGKVFGQAPFDELFILGLERDNDLWMRAHIGTHNGRKGSAPLGRTYALWNWEIDKSLYTDGLFDLKLSPFLDVGQITGERSLLTSRNCLWDTGVQVKVGVLGVGFTFTYGKDLRSGNNVFYLTAGQ